MVFPSRVDAWIVAAVLMASGGVAWVLATGQAGAGLPALGLALVGIGLPLSLLLHTRYIVTDDELLVVSGPFRWRIARASIDRIEPTRNPLSSPALSLDRLAVHYGRNRRVIVSPRDKAGFRAAVLGDA